MSEFEDRLNALLSNPEEMNKLSQMAQTLLDGGALGNLLGGETPSDSGNTESNRAGQKSSGLDGELLASVGRIFSQASGQENDKTALLEAMKPYLKQKRRDKIDQAMKLAKMARIAGIAFSEYGGK